MIKLFGADGIRGTIDRYPFRAEDLVRLSQALATWWLKSVRKPVILFGTDTRESSKRIKIALASGLTRAGVKIWDAGILPTAAVSFLVASNPDLVGGVIITASHGTIWESGIKIVCQDGTKTSNEDEQEIEEMFSSPVLHFSYQSHPEEIRSDAGFLQNYIRATVSEFETVEWVKDRILVDCANGASYFTTQAIFSNLGIHYALYNAVSPHTDVKLGSGSEYIRKYPHEFASEMRKGGANLGIALDGDADRVVFVDKDGLFYDGDMLMAILGIFLHDQNPQKNDTVIITQMSNSGLVEHFSRYNIKTQQVRNGDKYITDVLLNENLTLGGEQIGHIIIHNDQYHVTGDGLRTALWILKALSIYPGSELRDLLHEMRKWPQINVSVMLGGQMPSIEREIPGLVDLISRVQEEINPSRFECRPASTEPVYRIMLEAKATPLPVLVQQAMKLARHIQKHFGRQDEPVEILDCVNGGRIDPTFLTNYYKQI